MSSEPGTDLVLANPRTGEILTLDSETEDLAHWLDAVRALEWDIRTNKRIVSQEIHARMDKAATWTLHLPGLKVTGQSPAPEETWSGPELREALYDLVERGLISVEAADAAVETVVTYKPRKAGITALRKLGGEVAETVNRLCQQSERERRIHVTVVQ